MGDSMWASKGAIDHPLGSAGHSGLALATGRVCVMGPGIGPSHTVICKALGPLACDSESVLPSNFYL